MGPMWPLKNAKAKPKNEAVNERRDRLDAIYAKLRITEQRLAVLEEESRTTRLSVSRIEVKQSRDKAATPSYPLATPENPSRGTFLW